VTLYSGWVDWLTAVLLIALGGIVCFYHLVIWRDIVPGPPSESAAENIREAIAVGVTAVSILLPVAIGIIGFLLQTPGGDNQAPLRHLTSTAFFLVISLAAALWNLFRLPSVALVMNVAQDEWTAVFQIIQLFALFAGALRMFLGTLAAIDL
jgi:hypothetical protein